MENTYNKTFNNFENLDSCYEITSSGLILREPSAIKTGMHLFVVSNNKEVLFAIKESPLDAYYSTNFYSHNFSFSQNYLMIICNNKGKIKENYIIERYFPKQIVQVIAELDSNEFKKVLGELALRPIEIVNNYILFHDRSYFSERYLDVYFERLSSFEDAIEYLNKEFDIIIDEGTMDWEKPYFIIVTDDKKLYRKYRLAENLDSFKLRTPYLTDEIFNVLDKFIKTDFRKAYIPRRKEVWNSEDGNSYEAEFDEDWRLE